MAKFSIIDMMGSEQSQKNMEYKVIDINLLDESEENFYSTENIEGLKDSIELLGGVKQPLLVTKQDDRYIIAAGHRRYLACKSLVADGKEEYRNVPCMVDEQGDGIIEGLKIIMTNSTIRELSDWEKVEQVRKMKNYLKAYKDAGHELPGRLRDYVAEATGMSKSAVGRLEQVNKNLQPELKEELQKGNINISTAAELSKMSVADQKAVYEDTGGAVKTADIKRAEVGNDLFTGRGRPKEPASKLPAETRIYAIKTAMDMMQTRIKKIVELKQLDEEDENIQGVAARTALIEYIEKLIKIAQNDLFELTGQNMFKKAGEQS